MPDVSRFGHALPPRPQSEPRGIVVRAYHAACLALAEALDATLVTRDRAFASVGTKVRVDVL